MTANQNRLIINQCAVFWLLIGFCCHAQQPERVAIEIQPVRWQMLPQAIKSVCVGPDGRAWFRVSPDDSKPDDAEIRRALEKEYRATAPQLSKASLALLEANGRAWFLVRPNELWGYDGEKWIERKAAKNSVFTGYCPTRGQMLDNFANRATSGKVFFRDEQGVHVFDGTEWSYETLCPPLNSEWHLPRFAVSPNGKFAVAMTPRQAMRSAVLTDPDLWFWDDDTRAWEKRAIVWGENKSKFESFYVTDEGKLWCIQNGMIRVLNLAETNGIASRLPALIKQLDDDDAQIRQQAQVALEQVAEQIQPQLRVALQSASSAEMRRRLESLVQRASNFNAQLILSPKNETAGGPLFLRSAVAIFAGEEGSRYIFGSVTAGENVKLQRALVRVDANGSTKVFAPKELIGPEYAVPSEYRPPIVTDGKILWASGSYFPATRALTRLDLTTNEEVLQSSDLNYMSLMAVDSSGRAFITGLSSNGTKPPGVGVFSPQFPDKREVLQVETHAIAFPECVVTPDGKVWAARSDGLARFDGVSWELIHPVGRGYAYPTLAGLGGLMLCRTNGGYLLFSDNKLVAFAPLRRLITQYPEKFLAAFPPKYTPVQRQYRIWIATDTQKNIWLVENNMVAAFTGEHWVSGSDAAKFVPPVATGFGPQSVVTVGDGSKVFFSKALASIDDGKMVLADAPECSVDIQMPFGFRDREGRFLLPGYTPVITEGNTRRRDHQTVCLGENGTMHTVDKNAWPFLVDGSGNVWLAEMGRARPRSHFWIWREGNIVQELEIPGAIDMRTICSNRPGSVYVGNSLGLHHFVAKDEKAGKDFELHRTYAFPLGVVPPDRFSCPYSDLTGIVVANPRDLHLIKLPTD